MKLIGGPALCLVLSFLINFSLLAKSYKLNDHKGFPSQFRVNKEAGENRWSLKLSTSSFETSEFKEFPIVGNYQRVVFPLLKNLERPGSPALPFKSFIVKGKKEDLVFKMRRSGEHTFKGLKIAPAPLKPCRCSNKTTDLQSFSLNTEDYQQTAKNLYKVVDLGDFRGIPLSKIILMPAVQGENGLVVYEEIELVVEAQKGLVPPPIRGQNDKFLMIAPRKLISSADKFREYKESQGFDVELFEYEDIAASSNELKKFIHAEYQKTGFQYALLFGHEGLLPTEMVETSTSLQTPTDFPYFAMGGEGDILPDVFYGRITADNNQEVLGQLEKNIEYNERSWPNQNGVYRSLGIASNEGSFPTDVEYMRSMLSPLERELAIAPDYFFQDDSRSIPELINASLNQGVRWMNYIGHGSGDSWSSVYGREYLSSHVKKLKNDVVKPIIIDVACQNGRFNNNGKLGETFMNARNWGRPVGAVAYYGGSVDISWDPPAVMATKIGEELSHQKVESLYALILRGQFLLLQEYGDPDAAKENLLWYNLLGDPSLSVTLP